MKYGLPIKAGQEKIAARYEAAIKAGRVPTHVEGVCGGVVSYTKIASKRQQASNRRKLARYFAKNGI
jgi:hypothetical protein